MVVGAGAAGSAAAAVLPGAGSRSSWSGCGRPPYNRTTVNKGLLSGAVSGADIGLPDLDVDGVDGDLDAEPWAST